MLMELSHNGLGKGLILISPAEKKFDYNSTFAFIATNNEDGCKVGGGFGAIQDRGG